MNEEALIWQNKAAEAEQKRQALQNKINQLDVQGGHMVKALEEARQFLDHPERYKDREKAALRNMISAAIGMYRAQRVEVSEPLRGFQLFAQDPPEEPETDSWYWDGKNINWFYLGKWHEGRTDE